MNELRPKIDPSEKGDLASQLSALTESGALKVRTEVPQETPSSTTPPKDLIDAYNRQMGETVAANDETKIRGGRGSRMAPGSLTSTLQEIRKEEGRIKYEEEDELEQINKGVKELNAAHIIFASNIKTLQNKLSKNPPPAEEKRLNIMLSMVEEQMRAIEKILPINTNRKSYDSDALKTGISRFKEYEEARRKQMLAEINQLEKNKEPEKLTEKELKQLEEDVRNTQRKANYLSGEIFELTKNEREKSLQERKVLNAETTNSTTMPENPQAPSQPQEIPATPESVVPQTPKLSQEALDLLHNAGGIPMFVTSNLKRIAEENGVSVSGTDTPNQIIEKLQALDNGEVITPQATTVTESIPTEPTITIEPAQGAVNSLQDEALAILENEGGLAPEATPEPKVATEITVENISEAITPVEASENSKVETAEEKKERILSSIYKFHNVELPERAKKAGMSEKMLDVLRAGGEVYKELPLKKKVFISLALFGTAWIAGGTIASVAMGGSVTQRVLGGMATFVVAEGALKASAEKDGRERGAWEKRRHTAEALIAGFLVGGGAVGQAFQNIFSPIAETVAEVNKFYSDAPLTHTEAPVATAVSPENMAVAGSFIEIAKSGDTVWKMAETQLQNHGLFKDLSPAQQTYLIDAVKDRIEQNPAAFGVADINNIEVGKGIDFTNALNDKEFIANALAHAQGLSPEEIANIKNFDNSKIPEAEVESVGGEEIPTAEAVPVSILESSPVSEVIAHPDAHIKVGNIEGDFKYSPDGKTVVGFISTGTLEYPETLEAKKILNDGWRGIVLSNETGLSSLNTSVVEDNAKAIYQYEQLLEAFEKQGGGMTPEADFLRDEISRTITDTEKTYGDVFKDIGGAPEAGSAIPAEGTSTMPQEINPGNPEVATSASKYVHDYINEMFGSKGIFGFGAVDGMKTPNWLDFANRPVAEIMQAQPNPTPSSAGLDVGMKNNDALTKIQQYLKIAINETGVQPVKGETTEKFLNRAAEMALGKIK